MVVAVVAFFCGHLSLAPHLRMFGQAFLSSTCLLHPAAELTSYMLVLGLLWLDHQVIIGSKLPLHAVGQEGCRLPDLQRRAFLGSGYPSWPTGSIRLSGGSTHICIFVFMGLCPIGTSAFVT